MKKFLPSKEYYKSLSKKHMGAGVLLFNRKNELLIVKPSYKKGWSIPGGTIDANESPRECAIRETKEEIGIKLKKLRLVCIDYKKTKGYNLENLQFIFYGGILSDKEMVKINLENKELKGYKFISVNDNLNLLRPNLRKRLPNCLKAIKTNSVFYLEETKKIGC